MREFARECLFIYCMCIYVCLCEYIYTSICVNACACAFVECVCVAYMSALNAYVNAHTYVHM